ncbi:hypothetical protein Tco_0317533 [Tanacetum coccineum]
MMVQAQEEMGEGSANPTDPHHTPIITQPSTSQSQKKQKPRKSKRKDTQIPQSSGPTEPIADEAANEENVPTHSNDLLLSGKDSLKLNELMELYTTLQKKVGLSAKVVSSNDEASLGDQEDASKQGRKILDIDTDEDITLDSTHFDTNPDIFRVHDLDRDELFVETKEPMVNVATTTTTTATTTVANKVEMTLAQTLIEIKSVKPKAKGIVMQEPSKSTLTISSQQPSQVKGQGSKDKGEGKMIKPEKPLKNKDQVLFDEQEAIRLQAQFDEESRAMQQEKELTIEEKSKLFQQLLEKRRKFFAAKRVEEKRNRPPTKAQQKEYNISKRAGDELEQEKAKKQKIDDDQEETKMKELVEVVSDEEGVAIDVIPLSTKPPSIVDYKIIKEGKISIYQIIRADGCSKRYSAIIHMLRNFDREDLETLWKIVKARHGYTRP